MPSLLEAITADFSKATFFKELCFAGQTFPVAERGESELADVFVWLESDGIIIQVKERDEHEPTDQAAFDKWFSNKVLGKGSDQIASTLAYFKKHPSATVKNARGVEFELSELDAATMHKVIVFGMLKRGVEQHHQAKFHKSQRSGFIHLIQAFDFTNLLHWTVTPGEMLAYLRFREAFVQEHREADSRTEKWLFGCFIRWSNSRRPAEVLGEDEAEQVVDSLKDDRVEVGQGPFLDFLGEWAAGRRGGQKVFARMVTECAHLTRPMAREFKIRLLKCLSRLDKPAPLTLYRMHNLERDCVCVFGVLRPRAMKEVEEDAAYYTMIAKYVCRTSKAMGVFFTPFDAEKTGTTPVYLEGPWEANAEADEVLAGGSGSFFRPLDRRAETAYKVRRG